MVYIKTLRLKSILTTILTFPPLLIFAQQPAVQVLSAPQSNSDLKELSIGITGGIVASIIILLFQQFWVKLIVPWYEERVYQDTRINGKWKSTFKFQNDVHEELVEINSRGHEISGLITVTKGKYHGKVFEFSGNFRNLLLVGTYHSKSNTDLDRGTFTMLLKKNGSVLEGICALYKGATNSIDHAEYIWQRIPKNESEPGENNV